MPRSKKSKQVAARDRYRVEVDERTAEYLDLDRGHRRLSVEEHLLWQAGKNYDAIRSARMTFDDLERLNGGRWR